MRSSASSRPRRSWASRLGHGEERSRWLALGIHVHVEDADPLFGGGETIVDFVPTADERAHAGLSVFISVLVLGLHGTWHGRNRLRDEFAHCFAH